MQDNPTPELLALLAEFQQSNFAVQRDIKKAERGEKGPRFSYASETAINKHLQPLAEKGIARVFTMKAMAASEGETIGQTEVTLRLFHGASGGFLSSSMLVSDYDPSNLKDIRHQQRGGGITYARRYLLSAIVGQSSDDNAGECAAIDLQDEEPRHTKTGTTTKPKQKPPSRHNGHQPPSSIAPIPPADAKLDVEQIKAELKPLFIEAGGKIAFEAWRPAFKAHFKLKKDEPQSGDIQSNEQLTWTRRFLEDKIKSLAT